MRKADNLLPSCAVVTKSGDLNFLEPSGPAQACNGTDFYHQSNTGPFVVRPLFGSQYINVLFVEAEMLSVRRYKVQLSRYDCRYARWLEVNWIVF